MLKPFIAPAQKKKTTHNFTPCCLCYSTTTEETLRFILTVFLLSPQQTRAFEVVKWLRLACKGEQIDFINRKNRLSFKWADLVFLGGANLVQAAFSKLLPVYLLPFISREGFSIVCASVAQLCAVCRHTSNRRESERWSVHAYTVVVITLNKYRIVCAYVFCVSRWWLFIWSMANWYLGGQVRTFTSRISFTFVGRVENWQAGAGYSSPGDSICWGSLVVCITNIVD